MEGTEGNQSSFFSRRISVFAILSVLFALVFFQRMCPSVVAETMSVSYGVDKNDIGIFSSIFFYPYALIQPFAGLLADIMEPAYLIGTAHLIAATGAVITGFSSSLTVGCIGRFLVGLGCGPTYVPIVRVITNWFKLDQMATMLGVQMAIGGLGSLASQAPLAAFEKAYGWRTAFFGIAGIGYLFSIICFFFVKGNPVDLNFPPVNKDLSHSPGETTFSEKMDLLVVNFKKVISYGPFWIVVLYNIFSSGPYFDIGGLWASPFLKDIYKFSSQEAGNLLLGTSIGMIGGSLVIPSVSTYLGTRKWVLFFASCISAVAVSLFFFFGTGLSKFMIFVVFLILGAFTNSMTSVAYPMIREYYHPSVAATSVGCANVFTFLSSAIFQQFTSSMIPKYGIQTPVPGQLKDKYTEKGYKICLWLFCTISLVFASIIISISKDSTIAPKEKSDDEIPEEKTPVKETGEELGEL